VTRPQSRLNEGRAFRGIDAGEASLDDADKSVIEHIFACLVFSSGNDRAFEWIKSLKDQKLRDKALSSLVSRWSMRDRFSSDEEEGVRGTIEYARAQKAAGLIVDPLLRAEALCAVANSRIIDARTPRKDRLEGPDRPAVNNAVDRDATAAILSKAIEAIKEYESDAGGDLILPSFARQRSWWMVGLGGLVGTILAVFGLTALNTYGEAAGRAMVNQILPIKGENP
jgi:hypothetical protein